MEEVIHALEYNSYFCTGTNKQMGKFPGNIKVTKETFHLLNQGDEAAFEKIYWQYSSWIYNFIHSLLHDKQLSEDLTQTVFLKIWERKNSIDPEGNFESYVFTIARHLVYKETANRLLNELFLETFQNVVSEQDNHTEAIIDTESLRLYVVSLVEQMPPARQQIYRLSRWENLSNKEIAERLSLSEKTIETQIYRALQFLKRKLLEEKGLAILLSLFFID